MISAIAVSGFWNWVHRLGAPGLILLGLADNSVVPLPGSMDAFTIILSAHNRDWWWLYAIAATIGAVAGGYLTFRLARQGEEAIERKQRKIPPKQLKKIQALFRRWGFASLAVAAILPPPLPIVPFLVTAGVMKYPTRKFLSALAVGRGIRYTIVAYLGRTYGRQMFGFVSEYSRPILIVLIALAVLGAIVLLLLYRARGDKWRQKSKRAA
jgi:membrane protein YqaA with SNARE-associated domain